MKTILRVVKMIMGVILVTAFAALTVLGTKETTPTMSFVGLVGVLVATVGVVWRQKFPNGLSYVLIMVGLLRAVFPVTACVPYGYGPGAARSLGYTAYFPWACQVQVQPLAGITAVQAIVLIGVGAWWLWWQKARTRFQSGPV
jgi:hypothetical protein